VTIVTGSHTPSEYNGLKFFDKLGIMYNDKLRKLEKKYLENDYKLGEWDELGKVSTDTSAIKEYIEDLSKKIKLSSKIKVVLDCGNGTAGLVSPEALKRIGCEVVIVNAEADGSFPNRSPEPNKENTAYLQKRVVESKADFGCAFDCDADRSVFIDDTGRALDGSIMSAVFSSWILEKNKNSYIVASVDMSSVVKNVVEKLGGNMVWCPVGMNNISRGLIENKGMFAGEVSSHFYFNDFYSFSDGTLACAKLAQLLAEKKTKLSKLADELPKYYIKHSKFNIQSHAKKIEAFERIKKELAKNYDLNIIDGVKLFLNETDWVLIRPSNTEPIIRLTIEASKEEDLKKYVQEFSKLVEKLL
jgi:phosphomannomutase/phosphoglucomutase